jgi:predicted regulator of Ras-like GTPase activity (Roadblock/LC7/MglB family)
MAPGGFHGCGVPSRGFVVATEVTPPSVPRATRLTAENEPLRMMDSGVEVWRRLGYFCWACRPVFRALVNDQVSEDFEGWMAKDQMVMYEEEFNQIQLVVDKLVKDANAKVVFIVDKNGQLIAAAGDVDNLDTTSLASLTAGNIAATGGMAKLLREEEFATQFHEGSKQNVHIQLVGNRVILVVIFDSRSSLGLVRLRVKKASEELNKIFESLLKKVQEPGADTPFGEITDEDIDNLFND